MSPDLASCAGPHVLVDDVFSLAVRPDDWHHLRRVLRLRPGDELTVSDGQGRWRRAIMGDEVVLEAGPVVETVEPAPISVGFALVKGAKPELIVQKLTEVGVSEICPFVADRSVVRWDDAKEQRAHERLERIAREAAMQSKRAWLPVVRGVVRFAELVDDGTPVVRADIGAPVLGHDRPETRRVLVGPEGGWSDAERAAVPDAVGLNTNVLRSETAAIAVAVLLAHQTRT